MRTIHSKSMRKARVVCALLAAGAALLAGGPARADEISVWDFQAQGDNTLMPPMGLVGMYGLSTVYRTDLTPLLSGLSDSGVDITHVAVLDGNSRAGSDGVFSGFDLDFILFDHDGVLNGNEFGVINQTLLSPGAVRNPALSPYRPTAAHPGPLFGTNTLGQLQSSVATLGARDASFRLGIPSLTVDTSSGWVSLGDNGWIVGTVEGVTYQPGDSLYLFVGDAGMNDETMDAFAQLYILPREEFEVLEPNAGGPYHALYTEPTLTLDGSKTVGQSIVSWLWKIDGVAVPSQYADSNSPWLAYVPFSYLRDNYYNSETPDHVVLLEVLTGDGQSGDDSAELTIEVPEPATLAILVGGALLLLVRRRRRNN